MRLSRRKLQGQRRSVAACRLRPSLEEPGRSSTDIWCTAIDSKSTSTRFAGHGRRASGARRRGRPPCHRKLYAVQCCDKCVQGVVVVRDVFGRPVRPRGIVHRSRRTRERHLDSVRSGASEINLHAAASVDWFPARAQAPCGAYVNFLQLHRAV